MYKPGQIITIKPDGIHNKRFRITKTSPYRVCTCCREANINIRDHTSDVSCPSMMHAYICSRMQINYYLKPID